MDDSEQDRCPTCGKFLELDPDGFYDTEPGGRDGFDYLVPYCNADCAARKNPPSIPAEDVEAHAPGRFSA